MTLDPLTFLDEFRAEVSEHLMVLDEQLLRLERDPNETESIRAMFLAAHSIKGGAAMLGLVEIRELSHAVEGVLAALREHHRGPQGDTADVLFRGVDRLRALTAAVDGTPHSSSPATMDLIGQLAACATALAPVPVPGTDAARVLLVEDSASVRQVETFLLQDAGFVVDGAEAADEALAWALTATYVLVVAGLETRELRGPDLVLALRARDSGPHAPVMLTTTDHSAASPPPLEGVVFAPKGQLDTSDFLRVVRQLTSKIDNEEAAT